MRSSPSSRKEGNAHIELTNNLRHARSTQARQASAVAGFSCIQGLHSAQSAPLHAELYAMRSANQKNTFRSVLWGAKHRPLRTLQRDGEGLDCRIAAYRRSFQFIEGKRLACGPGCLKNCSRQRLRRMFFSNAKTNVATVR